MTGLPTGSVIADRQSAEVNLEHRTDAGDLHRDVILFAEVPESLPHAVAGVVQSADDGLRELLQRGDPCGHGNRVAVERSAVGDLRLARRGIEERHDVLPPPESAYRKPAANDLAKSGQIRPNAEEGLGTAPA